MSNESAKMAFYEDAHNRLTVAALLELADNPAAPATTERMKIHEDLMGEDIHGEFGPQISCAYRMASGRALVLYAQLTEAVEECFEPSREER